MKKITITCFSIFLTCSAWSAELSWSAGASTLNNESSNSSDTVSASSFYTVTHPEGGVSSRAAIAAGYGGKAVGCSSGGSTYDPAENASSTAGASSTLNFTFDNTDTIIVTFSFPHSVRAFGSTGFLPQFAVDRGEPYYTCSSSANVIVRTSVTSGTLLSEYSGFQAKRGWSQNSQLASLTPGFSRVTYSLEPGATLNIQNSASVSASSGGAYGGGGGASAYATVGTNLVATTDVNGNPIIVAVTADASNVDWQPNQVNIMPFSDWMVGFSELPTDAVEEDDIDGDGWSNYLEYLCQTSPTDPSSNLSPALELDNSGLYLRLNQESPLARYHIFRSEIGLDIADFQEVIVYEPTALEETPPSITLPSTTADKGFYRIQIEEK